jgi:hypothetical protein
MNVEKERVIDAVECNGVPARRWNDVRVAEHPDRVAADAFEVVDVPGLSGQGSGG